MTDLIYFDTDCLSSFFWVNQQYLLIRLYKGKVNLSQQVYREIAYVPQLKREVDKFIASDEFTLCDFHVGSPEQALYMKLTRQPEKGRKIIGYGEASVISLAKCRSGIVGSNNLKDIREYLDDYNLRHISTAEILNEALNQKLIDIKVGNKIWRDMRNRNIWLPAESFSDYYARNSHIK